MKKIKTFLKAHWILVWLVAVAVAFTAIVSAEYIINKNRVRRVIANVPNEGQQFSSNYLKDNGSSTLTKVSFNEEEVTEVTDYYCVVPINIWNHSETNPNKAYEGVLRYNWIMQLVDKNGHLITSTNPDLAGYNVGYSSNGTDFTNFNTLTYDNEKGYFVSGTDVFNQTDLDDNYLVGEHKYYLRFPKTALLSDPEIYVKMTATPVDTKGLSEIGSILGVQKAGSTITRVWSGRFGDAESYTDYDAFNYILSGSGEANITLSWCENYLAMNPINIAEYGWGASITPFYKDSQGNTGNGGVDYTSEPTGGQTWKKLTFTADSNASVSQINGVTVGVNRYDIQFYMTGDPANDYIAENSTFWDTVKDYVVFSAE